MVSELDTYRTAGVLIREHGENAALEAAILADKMLEQGSLDGQRIWKRILAIGVLLCVPPALGPAALAQDPAEAEHVGALV